MVTLKPNLRRTSCKKEKVALKRRVRSAERTQPWTAVWAHFPGVREGCWMFQYLVYRGSLCRGRAAGKFGEELLLI